MKRTPMLPKNPALPSRGPTTLAVVVCMMPPSMAEACFLPSLMLSSLTGRPRSDNGWWPVLAGFLRLGWRALQWPAMDGHDDVSLTNLDQPLFDDAQATKRDLIEYV